LKIWFDDQIFTIQQYGGISRYFTELAKGMTSTGQSVHIDAPVHINRYLDGIPCSAGRRIPSFRGVTRLCQMANGFGLAGRMASYAPEIVHETYYCRHIENARVPYVLTMHDMIHELFADAGCTDALAQARRAAVSRADHIICVSENTRQDMLAILGVDKARTSVIYHGVSLKGCIDGASPMDQPYLLYVGPRSGYKNFSCLLQAYAASTQLRSDFRILCFGGGGLSTTERAAMRRLGLEDAAVSHLSGNDHLLASLFAHASAFVYPSRYEGFGMSPLEAMQCGCPVVCADSSSLPEVVGDAALMFDPASSEALGIALEQMLYVSGMADDYRERGRRRAAVFTWQRCVAETLACYRDLLGGKHEK